MALTHALSTNNYGTAAKIVATSAANGTHTTLAAAMADSSSGETIFLRDSVVENVTITPGVNIACWTGGTLNVPSITGLLTMTGAGTSTISGLRLVTNSAALIAVTGSAASILNVNRCYLNCSNNSGITFSTSNGSAEINLNDCLGDLGTTGIGLFTHTSAGSLSINYSRITNTGNSLTASTCSAGNLPIKHSELFFAITTSSTASFQWDYSSFQMAANNTTAATLGGSGVHACRYCRFSSGTASAVSIGSATPTFEHCIFTSSNTNAVTGAGTITGNTLNFEGTSSLVNTTTQTPLAFGIGTSWTPNIQINASNTGITYTTQVGGYIILGNAVFIWAQVILSSKGVATGNVTLSNLPIAVSASGTSKNMPMGEYNQVTKAGYTSMGLRLANSAIGTFILSSASGSAVTILTNAEISDTFQFRFSGVYIIT